MPESKEPKVTIKTNQSGPPEIVQKSTAVVDWKEQLSKLAVAVQEAEKPAGNWISFKSGILAIGGQPIKGNTVKLVIINSLFENQFYANKYDPNNQQPPVCYAFGETDDDLRPHPESAEIQNEKCEGCPRNEWGSDRDGGKGKACKNVRRLAMISATDLESPETVAKAEVALAKLPVTSVKNWSTYANQIANVLRVPPLAVITEMSVEPDAKTQFQVNFTLIDRIEDGAIIQALLNKRRDTIPLINAPYDKPTPQQPAQPRKF
jgi:hypothetical protein